MFWIIINFIMEVVTIVLVAALGGTICFLVLSVLKMLIDELRGE